MDYFERPERDVASIKLPEWGRVGPSDGPVPFTVYDDADEPIEAVHRYLRDFVARGNSAGSVRSYAYTLLRWWRFLRAVDVAWDRATAVETKDLVLWLQHTEKPVAKRRVASAATAGTVNPVTRKEHLGDQYKPRTVRHSNAVLRAFYEYWIEEGQGPLLNPVPRARRGARPNAHHNALEPFRPEGRLRYNPKVPKQKPRAMPDEAWLDLFKAMKSNRDRAILTLAISTAARASELLGLRACDIDWGDQLIRVRRKGSGAEQWLPASSEAFVWLRLYLAEVSRLRPGDPLWWTLRRQHDGERPRRVELTYDALRAVLRRANGLLGANWSMHDCRHTCALRMARDKNLSLRDVQLLLGHAHLTTTQIYLEDDDAEVVKRVQEHHAERGRLLTAPPRPLPASRYDADDMSVLFANRVAQ
ncbi:site-specific integrase [Actinoplanes oblitus]|uniref:Site-specific integrase n=1 Tax=Actinoplanes oblitus TaxID=3040509 RepID=A0ABY8WRG2_9ACTN|nr:site-specific integrase [Actinoplanes oblitus]WIN00038.1 site-specific integrase [Actinoplanes oblitus]